jgi:hypothetical protein
MQTLKRERELAKEIEEGLDAEFRKCVELVSLRDKHKMAQLSRGKPVRSLLLPPRCSNLVPLGQRIIRVGQ